MSINTAFLWTRKKNNSYYRREVYIDVENLYSFSSFMFKVTMKENKFQSKLIRELKIEFPGCIVLKNDAGYIQGIPDLLILYKNYWAALECKKSEKASHQPNQDYYISKMNGMSFASFIYPENKEEILDELQRTFRVRRSSRVSISK